MNPDLQKQLTWNAQRNECMQELLAIAEQARHQLAPDHPKRAIADVLWLHAWLFLEIGRRRIEAN